MPNQPPHHVQSDFLCRARDRQADPKVWNLTNYDVVVMLDDDMLMVLPPASLEDHTPQADELGPDATVERPALTGAG